MQGLQDLLQEYENIESGQGVIVQPNKSNRLPIAVGQGGSTRAQSNGVVSSRKHGAQKSGSGRQSASRKVSVLASVGSMVTGSSRPTTPEQLENATHVQQPLRSVPDDTREDVCARLCSIGYLGHDHQLFMHGRGYTGPLRPARVTWKSDKPPRKDHRTPPWLTATEFQDPPEVLRAKCRQLAGLMRLSKKTVLYTGAGISASVIGQAALSGQNKVGWKPDKLSCPPTFTHHALGFLGKHGVIHSWVQQNHDGLPQKAGFPQECINEIHGSWYDPSNPVVKYSGSLHRRAFPWMEDDAETADLVLVLGTSLGGLNADQVVENAAERSLNPRGALGTVCINLQQTPQDGKMTLRFFGRSDDILPVLLEELGFDPLKPAKTHWPDVSRVLVPYDSEGRLVPDGSKKMWLDLRDRQKIKITPGHNIQGAKQPQYMHIGKSKPGLGTVLQRDESTSCFSLSVEGANMRLGLWWLDAAMRGAVDVLPIVNERPVYENDVDTFKPHSQTRSSSRVVRGR